MPRRAQVSTDVVSGAASRAARAAAALRRLQRVGERAHILFSFLRIWDHALPSWSALTPLFAISAREEVL